MESFSTNPLQSISRDLRIEGPIFGSDEEFLEALEINRILEWISCVESPIALQFPDHLLPYAPRVASVLGGSDKGIHVLGDTTYSPCCVDLVASQRLGAKSLVHFGEACHTEIEDSSGVSVLYVYTSLPLILSSLRNILENRKKEEEEEEEKKKTLIVYDVGYHKAIFRSSWPENVSLAVPSSSGTSRVGGRSFPSEESFEDIIYVGNNPSFRLLLAFSWPSKKLFNYNPSSESLEPAFRRISQVVMKRYFGIEKARDAERIGILMGTLSSKGYPRILENLRNTINKSGKRSYSFLVGKPNPAKLANFPEIDIFVNVSCPLSVYALAADDSAKDYLCPVMSPFELDIALNENREWEGRLTGDFTEILPGGSMYKEFAPKEDPDVSLITGGIRYFPSSVQETENEFISDGRILKSETRLSKLHVGGGAGEFLASRTWQGLEQKLGETTVPSSPIEGRTGIPSRYEDEPKT